MAPLSTEAQLDLIRENIAEVMRFDIIEQIIDEGRTLKVYWGTATTGRPHCGYLVPAIKIAQFLAAGCEMTILLADVHAYLDNLKAPLELVAQRAEYYRFTITSLLKAVGVPTDQLRFVLGSSYQHGTDYTLDLYKLSSLVTQRQAQKAAAEVVKSAENPSISGLFYPLMQVLDEQYLDCDAQFGGLDQRKLFAAATEWLPKLKYRKRAHIMNPMVTGLNGQKMSSSDTNSKIDLLDPPEVVAKKIQAAECLPLIWKNNPLMDLVEFVLLPGSALKTGVREFRVERRGAAPLVYTTMEQVRADYEDDVLTPQMVKPAVAKALADIIAPIQAEFQASQEWQEVALKAYPAPAKKEKKVRNKGTQFPGAQGEEAKTDGVAQLDNLAIDVKEVADGAPAEAGTTHPNSATAGV
ncbi:Tyrosine--tRNA ligase cytoplasmic [Fusarium piperis]|uniref:Tyrosine--tRNA ligase n=1 Tax=Fusarium piperis TaxID=1435070 RepID=A0A9W8WL18_9HYPO|nr:Tyrosine--tRNA ligase cytoplasmic [Fusarium piperis]